MFTKKIYVGNLPYNLTNNELSEVFAEAGSVESASVVLERETMRGRGFGFVKMADEAGFNKALELLNGREVGGRPLTVKEANERPAGPRSTLRPAQGSNRSNERLSWTHDY